MSPWPGENSHVGVSPVIALPAPFFTVRLNRRTSPVRACGVDGAMEIDEISAGTTSTLTLPFAPPADPVIVAVPAFVAVITPSATDATVADELLHATGSVRVSPAADNTFARNARL